MVTEDGSQSRHVDEHFHFLLGFTPELVRPNRHDRPTPQPAQVWDLARLCLLLFRCKGSQRPVTVASQEGRSWSGPSAVQSLAPSAMPPRRTDWRGFRIGYQHPLAGLLHDRSSSGPLLALFFHSSVAVFIVRAVFVFTQEEQIVGRIRR